MDRGAWWAMVRGVTESQTRLSDWKTNSTQGEETPARNWEGKQEEKAADKRRFNTGNLGRLSLNPGRQLNTHLGVPASEGDGSQTSQFLPVWGQKPQWG